MDWEDEIAGDTQALTAFTQTHIDRRDSLLFTFWPKKSTTKIAWAAQIVKIHQLRKISIVNFIAVEESGIGTSKHFHMACEYSKNVSLSAFKKYFSTRKINVHITGTADYRYYFNYLYVPSKKKPIADLDPNPTTSTGHVFSDRHINLRTAVPRLNYENFFYLLKSQNLRVYEELVKYISTLCDEEQASMFSFVCKRTRIAVESDIEMAWSFVNGFTTPPLPDRQANLRAAFYSLCSCDGNSISVVTSILDTNNIEYSDFCTQIMTCLIEGAGKNFNVAIIGRSNCGKTTLLKFVESLFEPDQVFRNPLSGSSFPLLNLPGKMVCILNDFRAFGNKMKYHDYLVWFEGEPFYICTPKNLTGTDIYYTYQAPILVTSGEEIEFRQHGFLNIDQTEMMSNRFTYFKLHTPIRNPADRVSTCKRCFMRFLSKHCTTSIFNKKRKAAEFPTVRPQGVSESMWKSIKRQRNLALKNEEGDSAALP